MNSRQKAIEELKKQIRLRRERLGPEGIKELDGSVAAHLVIKDATTGKVIVNTRG